MTCEAATRPLPVRRGHSFAACVSHAGSAGAARCSRWPWPWRSSRASASTTRLLDPGEHFEAFGDPLSLVLTGTRDPTRFVYLSEGVGDWAVRHELGGFEGFAAGIGARRPAVVVVDAWTGPLALRTER